MSKEFTASTPEEIQDVLDDPNKIITEVKLTMENKDKDPNAGVTEEGFEISADFILAMYRKAKKSNANIEASFNRCAKLGNATVRIIVEPNS